MRKEFNAKRLLTIGGSVLLCVLIVGYGIWISRDLLFGITSRVSGITDGMATTESLISLEGRARRAGKVTLNGRMVAIDQKGSWTDTIALLPGYNVITITATDKFSRTKAASYRVYYTGPKGVQ